MNILVEGTVTENDTLEATCTISGESTNVAAGLEMALVQYLNSLIGEDDVASFSKEAKVSILHGIYTNVLSDILNDIDDSTPVEED